MGSIEEKDGKILIPEADYLNILKTARGDSTDDCHLSDDEFSENEENSDSNEDDQSDQVDLIHTFEQSSL